MNNDTKNSSLHDFSPSFYHVGNNEQFSSANFPNVALELTALNEGISHIPIYFKGEILISYLKDHSLKTDWIDANPALAKLVTSGFLKTSHIEALFESCRRNKPFLSDFEAYMNKQLMIRQKT
jgi:hypothetical protein